jgi:alpha-aminoadipate/glutamate carrier protein LysW
MTHCPECEAEITVRDLIVGEIIYCPDCSAELEVLRLEPPAVVLAPEVEEDWGE